MDMIKKIRNFFRYWYIRYLMATEMYMVEHWEKVIVHIMFTMLIVGLSFFNYTFVVSTIAQLRATPPVYWLQI